MVKTLTITEDAYNALKRLKYGEKSFSEVIIEITKERKGDIREFYGILKDSKEGLADMMKKIRERRNEIEKEIDGRRGKITKRNWQ